MKAFLKHLIQYFLGISFMGILEFTRIVFQKEAMIMIV